ncbi:copper-exporting ATPase [Naegleria gruberi]|uniref:P-type Cu(+) transporter n=1 Tax=Naegleria gruberi TaxID=5762 RepID=D2VBD9_NAEGR|nr:copper-exporting ATPase [Naegleria gruberi]EFC45778.1 copper-exporting ATPase [Naegleria gruberi]|eukprot:XP_002678522.1 copper-exporting ATPase [Naegleria gruberi strain NEG-M]
MVTLIVNPANRDWLPPSIVGGLSTSEAEMFVDKNSSCGCSCSSCQCTSVIKGYFDDSEEVSANAVASSPGCGCSSSCCGTLNSVNADNTSSSVSGSNSCSTTNSSGGGGGCIANCFMKRIRQIYHFEIVLVRRKNENMNALEIIESLKDQAFISIAENEQELKVYVSGYVSLFELMRNLYENNKKQFRIKSARTMKVHQVKFDDSCKMKCRGCSSRVEKAFADMDDIAHLYCDLDDQTVIFFFNKENTRSLINDILTNDLKKTFNILNTDIEIQNHPSQDDNTSLTLKVEGMRCGGCSSKVKKLLKESYGTENVDIDLNSKKVIVRGVDAKLESKIIEDIEMLGFTCSRFSEYKEHNITVNGMKCGGCKNKITKALESDEKIHFVDVNLESKLVSVQCDYEEPGPIIQKIEELGFTCEGKVEIYSVKTSKSVPTSSYRKEVEEDRSFYQPSPTSEMNQYSAIDLHEDGDEEIEMHDVRLLSNKEGANVPHDESAEHSSNKKCVLSIDGMSCASCVSKIERNVRELNGVSKCSVNLIMQKGEILYDESVISERELIKKVESLGFQVTSLTDQLNNEKNKLMVSIGTSSKESFVDFLTGVKGVFDIGQSVEDGNPNNTILTILFDDKTTKCRTIFDQLVHKAAEGQLGEVKIVKSSLMKNQMDTLQRKHEIRKWAFYFGFSALLTIPAMVLMMLFGNIHYTKMALMNEVFPGLSIMSLVMFLLVTPVQIIGGYPFYLLSLKALKSFSLDMNVLIAIATTEAYGYSLFTNIYNLSVGKITIEHDYFETAAALIMFLSLGRLLESVAKGKTSSALVTLLDLQPSVAILVGENNTESEIDVDLVQEGDILKVIRASKVPVDGVIVSLDGDALVDEQMITGESMPVTKKVGSEVIGGTVNVGDTYFFMRATRVGSDSTLSGIAKLVEQAQTDKPQIQGLADKVSAWFVPLVIILSLVVFAVWAILGAFNLYPKEWRADDMSPYIFALLLSTSTVIISCPCALGLAVPTATMVGTGLGAKHGILIKGGSPIEIVKKATCVTFDKTGTLTKGELVVDQIEMFDTDVSDDDIFRWTAVAESSSEHPIGKAIVKYCKQHSSHSEDTFVKTSGTMSEFSAVSGRGLTCIIEGKRVDIGNEQFMYDQHVNMMSFSDSSRYQTLVFVSIDKKLKALFSLSDEVREESYQVVSELQKKGLKVYMLTGDNQCVANFVGDKLGIPQENIFSQLTPVGKTNKVKELQESKEIVIMIGDGINDSPSLIQADVGISVGQGTDVAIECAQIILMKNDLRALLSTISLCRSIYNRIVMNFVWAFGYNIIAIPFAAGIFFPLIQVMIPPWVAGIAMVSSSICVLLSSLSLRFHKMKY